jgi:hypothetical protein
MQPQAHRVACSPQLAHARYTQRVGGNHGLLLIEYLTDTKIPGPPTPQPSLSSLTLQLIAHVTALL